MGDPLSPAAAGTDAAFDPIPPAYRRENHDADDGLVSQIGDAIKDALAGRGITTEAPADEPDAPAQDPDPADTDSPAEGGAGGPGQPDASATADPGGAAAGGEPAAEQALPEVLRVALPNSDQHVDLDVPTAQRLLALAAWNENLPPEQRQQIAAIDAGLAIAVERAEFERYQAWRNSDAARDFDPDADLDPAVAQRIAALEARLAQATVQPQAQAISQSSNLAAAAIERTQAAYAVERGLAPHEVDALMQRAIEAQAFKAFAEQAAVHHPVTGQRIAEPDYATVTRQALDFALVQNPALHTRTFAPQATAAADPGPDPTAIKKARAGALASAPSAAVTSPPLDVRAMSETDRRAAMAADIRAAIAGR